MQSQSGRRLVVAAFTLVSFACDDGGGSGEAPVVDGGSGAEKDGGRREGLPDVGGDYATEAVEDVGRTPDVRVEDDAATDAATRDAAVTDGPLPDVPEPDAEVEPDAEPDAEVEACEDGDERPCDECGAQTCEDGEWRARRAR